MEKHRVNFEIGDSVKVKRGIMDPDVEGLCIEGWQGRVAEIPEGGTTILIRWDSITLENMPREYIELGEEEGWDYTGIYLEPQDVEVAKARDSEEEVAAVLERIYKSLSWSWLGEEGKRIQEVLAGVDEEDTMELFRCNSQYLI